MATIENRLGNDLSVGVHCRSKSKDDDLGLQSVVNGSDYSWEFGENFFTTTLFYCDVWWGSMGEHRAHFDAFKEWVSACPQFHCLWKVDQRALSTQSYYNGTWVTVHLWAR